MAGFLATSAAGAFEPPAWAGEANAEFSEWLNFTVPVGAPGNAPDVAGSTGDAVLTQNVPGAIITGSMNLYNPEAPSAFAVTDSFANAPDMIVLQATVSGTQLVPETVRLQISTASGPVFLDADREELSRVPLPGFGASVTSRWRWSLRGYDATNITIRFNAAGPHCSLAAARLDVRSKPPLILVTRSEPVVDRWNYSFNVTPGTRSVASTFLAPEDEGILRHGSFVVGFNSAPEIEAGLGKSAYEVASAKVILTTSFNFVTPYDSTVDPVYSYLTNGHPQFVEDEDPGRPLELFGAGFRNGFTGATWMENSPWAPMDGDRSVYPITLAKDGSEVDASLNVNFVAPFEVTPFALGLNADTTPGDPIPHDTPFEFDVDLSQAGVREYLARGVDEGRLYFTATSLHAGGQGMRTFPEYYTRETLLGEPPRLELAVRLYPPQEVITILAIQLTEAGRVIRFTSRDGADYGIRWTTDMKNWFLVPEPVLADVVPGVSEWTDDSEPGEMKFYQIYLKP